MSRIFLSGNDAFAYGIRLARPQVISAYPITPQTIVVERLSEIQRYAELAIGDTVVTDYSSRFPKDVTIGTVEDYSMTDAGYFNVKIRLATRFSAIRKVLLIKYYDQAERLWLEGYNG